MITERGLEMADKYNTYCTVGTKVELTGSHNSTCLIK